MTISANFSGEIPSAAETECDVLLLIVPRFRIINIKPGFFSQPLTQIKNKSPFQFRKVLKLLYWLFLQEQNRHDVSKDAKFSYASTIAASTHNRKNSNKQKHLILFEIHNKIQNIQITLILICFSTLSNKSQKFYSTNSYIYSCIY